MRAGLHHIAMTLGLGILVPCALWGQTILNQKVVGSSGKTVRSTAVEVSYTVGESVVTGIRNGSVYLGQGFHQDANAEPKPPLEVSTISSESQCPDYKTGSLRIIPSGCEEPYQIILVGNGEEISVNDINFDGYTFQNLDSGSYQVTVVGVNLCSYRDTFRIELKNYDCGVEYYTGITPNGDGRNDEWIIDNIEINQPNTVTIYSRWGQKVWQASNYNNSTIVWDGYNQNGNLLPDGTYFYTIEISGNQGASKSGWVQLTR